MWDMTMSTAAIHGWPHEPRYVFFSPMGGCHMHCLAHWPSWHCKAKGCVQWYLIAVGKGMLSSSLSISLAWQQRWKISPVDFWKVARHAVRDLELLYDWLSPKHKPSCGGWWMPWYWINYNCMVTPNQVCWRLLEYTQCNCWDGLGLVQAEPEVHPHGFLHRRHHIIIDLCKVFALGLHCRFWGRELSSGDQTLLQTCD